jgi:hypothetical protein
VAALVLALAVPATAVTKIGGSYRIRGVYWDQGLDKGKFAPNGVSVPQVEDGEIDPIMYVQGVPGVGRYFDNRLRLNIDSEISECLGVHVEADSGLGYNGRNGDFQNPAATPDSYDGIWNAGGSFLNLPEPGAADRDVFSSVGHDIVFQQAYLDFASPIGTFTLGRQWSFWGMGLLVGENRNRLAWSYEVPEFQIGAGYDKFFEGSSVFGSFDKGDDQDNYFIWALYQGKNFEFGPYLQYTHADTITTGASAVAMMQGVNIYSVSLYGNAQFGPLALTAEFVYQGGSATSLGGIFDAGDIDINSYAGVGRATYELPMITIGAEGGFITGQDLNETSEVNAYLTPYSFSPFSILGNFAINGMDLLGMATRLPGTLSSSDPGSYSDFVSNMVYGKLFAQASPIPKLDAYLGVGYAVSEQDRWDTGKGYLGTEVDLSLTYAITENLSYNFTGGYLFIGDFFDDANSAANISWYEGDGPTIPDALGTAHPEDAMLAVHSITVNW